MKKAQGEQPTARILRPSSGLSLADPSKRPLQETKFSSSVRAQAANSAGKGAAFRWPRASNNHDLEKFTARAPIACDELQEIAQGLQSPCDC